MSATRPDTHCIGKGAFGSMEAVMTVVGRVVALWRYPVKVHGGEELDGAEGRGTAWRVIDGGHSSVTGRCAAASRG